MYVGDRPYWPLGQDGLYGLTKVTITGLIEARGLTLENNQIEKEGGATRQNATPLPSGIVALVDWWPDANTQRTVAVTRGGGVYVDVDGAWTFTRTVLPEGTLHITERPPQLVAGGSEDPSRPRKLFVFTGNDPVRVGAGDFSTMTVLATPPADWAGASQPSTGTIHEGRLVGFLGHLMYASTAPDHEDFQGSGSTVLPIAPGQGERIAGSISFRKMLVVGKYPRGVHVVDTSSPVITDWRSDPQSYAVGFVGPLAQTSVPNDVLFVDAEFHLNLLSATNIERDAAASDLSGPKLDRWIPENINRDRAAWTQAVYYSDKHQVHVAAAALGTLRNARRLMVDFGNAQVGPRFTYSDRDSCEALMMRRLAGVERPYLGTDDGYVYKLDEATRAKDGVGYIGEFQTDHSDLGDLDPRYRDRKKAFDWLELVLEGVGSYDLNVHIWIDGKKKTTAPITFRLTGAAVPLGSFILDVDRLGAATLARRRRRLKWHGTRISIQGSNSVAGETFKIVRARLGVRLAE